MNFKHYFQNLQSPARAVDVVLDTDAYNEIDDQFAIAYMLRSDERLNVKAIYAAPFFNEKSNSPSEGMYKSYDEIIKILKLAKHEDLTNVVFKGSTEYLQNETQAVISDTAKDIVARAMEYTPDNPLYVVAIGAITNVASALLLKPEIKENIVVVWLGGNSLEHSDTKEFNMYQDVAAARVVFGCGVPLVQIPCAGVASGFLTTKYELNYWLAGKNALCDYLVSNTIEQGEMDAGIKVWSRVIWDVTAVAWLLNDDERFLKTRLIHSPIPEYDHFYAFNKQRHFINYVYAVNRDELFMDLFTKLAK